MGLHVRTVMPYALPGVLALLACWWFFSRKKDGRSKKHLSAFADKLLTDHDLEELPREEMPSSSWAQPVQLDKEEESILQEETACGFSLEAHNTYLDEMRPVCKAEEDLKQDLHLLNVAMETMQSSAGQELGESNMPTYEICKTKESGDVCMSSVLHISLETNKLVEDNSNAALSDIEERCPVSTEPPCVCGQESEVQELSTKVIDHLQNDIQGFVSSEMCFQSKAVIRIPEEGALVQQNVESCASEAIDSVSTLDQFAAYNHLPSVEVDFNRLESSASVVSPSHCDQNTVHEIPISINANQDILGKEEICPQMEDAQSTQTERNATLTEQGVNTSGDELQLEDIHRVGLPLKVDVEIQETQSLESFPSEQIEGDNSLDMCDESSVMEVKGVLSHDVEPLMAGELSDRSIQSIVEVVKEGNCTDIIDAFSKSVVKNEEFENSSPIVDSLKEVNTKTFMADYEAKIVEQLAINIISKVIVAARQEILSSCTSDPSDSSLVHEENDSIEMDTQSKHLVPESDYHGSDTANLTQGLINLDCTCESTQTEPSQMKDLRNGEATIVKRKRENGEWNEKNNIATHTSVHEMPSMSDFSPVHRSTDFFEVSQAAMEDSSISACTSEEGISMDDPLQSTALSTVCVGSFDSLSSSGIELSREMFNVSAEATTVVAVVESKTAGYSNGHAKRGSPDLNSEGPVTAESEVDHSGGSDVNSMDSVDSGCALGNGEQFQNEKQKSEVKKADLVIWEFEVPKYLVGRLIGKQGRFVSFLKQSSGAKIYISTVPYTQDIQICHLEGSQQQIDRALGLIRKKFKDLNLTNIFAPPPPMIPLPVASWLSLPNNVSVEVVVVNVVNAGHMFVQQRTHPTFHALCGLDHHMSLCYSQPGIPTLPTPAEVGILCAAPVGPNVWWRAQVMAYFEDSEEVEILYVDYGGYNRVKINTLRQIRSDFVSLPFQGVEVLLDNVIPLGDEDHFSAEADEIVKELTTGAPMLTQVTNYDEATRLPLVQLWRLNPEETVSINRTLVERGFAEWIENY